MKDSPLQQNTRFSVFFKCQNAFLIEKRQKKSVIIGGFLKKRNRTGAERMAIPTTAAPGRGAEPSDAFLYVSMENLFEFGPVGEYSYGNVGENEPFSGRIRL